MVAVSPFQTTLVENNVNTLKCIPSINYEQVNYKTLDLNQGEQSAKTHSKFLLYM